MFLNAIHCFFDLCFLSFFLFYLVIIEVILIVIIYVVFFFSCILIKLFVPNILIINIKSYIRTPRIHWFVFPIIAIAGITYFVRFLLCFLYLFEIQIYREMLCEVIFRIPNPAGIVCRSSQQIPPIIWENDFWNASRMCTKLIGLITWWIYVIVFQAEFIGRRCHSKRMPLSNEQNIGSLWRNVETRNFIEFIRHMP